MGKVIASQREMIRCLMIIGMSAGMKIMEDSKVGVIIGFGT